MRMLIRRMDRTGRLAAVRVTSLPIAIDVAREAQAIIAKPEVAHDVRYFGVENLTDGAMALIDGFSLVPGGWPHLEELDIARMDIHLFLTRHTGLDSLIYPALQVLDLTNIPAPMDGPTLFAGLSQLPHLRRLVLWLILFKKWVTPSSSIFSLSCSLSHYTFVQKDVDDTDGTPAGWHIPNVAPSKAPRELSLLLRDSEDLAPMRSHPSCQDAVETLHLSDGNAWSAGKFLPLEAYKGIARHCPRLKVLRLVCEARSMRSGLEMILADTHVPLRSVLLELVQAPVPTREALAEDDRALVELLHASAALQHLRVFSLLTFWEWHGLQDLEFPAIKAQCRSRAVIFEHDAR